MRNYQVEDLPAKLVRRITVNSETGCWVVSNSRPRSDTPSEYRGIGWNGGLWQCHVLAYTLLVEPVPMLMTIDHVYDRGCRYKSCCNPAHLEMVTGAENSARRARVAREKQLEYGE